MTNTSKNKKVNSSPYSVLSSYDFLPFTEETLKEIQEKIYNLGKEHHILGLFILAREGYNMSFFGKSKNVKVFKTKLKSILNTENISYKKSHSKNPPFLDLKVKIRKEIVNLNRLDLNPESSHLNSIYNYGYLSPKKWHEKLKNLDEKTVLLDIRNEYEIKLGKFKQALSSNILEFNEFPYSLVKHSSKKNKEFLIYCTGGIRCEKATLAMREKGFKNVYQLQGGILNYLLHYPHEEFEGECFVFDHRVAVDQNLKPTQVYHICPHCGDPGKTSISCMQCHRSDFICENCNLKGGSHHTCSKNCAHHFKMNHKTTRIHKESFTKKI